MKAMAVSEMAQHLGQPEAEVKRKMKALRTQFGKNLREIKDVPSGSATKVPSKRAAWLVERMQFLVPHLGQRSTTSNLDKQTAVFEMNYDDELSGNEAEMMTQEEVEVDMPGPKSTNCRRQHTQPLSGGEWWRVL
ncbi:PREDICTED: uncharacterized protein LOC106820174 [Priapulus caudatus]|uniref:Uncharacterized protein LOC106820174 n=1 Tax=Priapulus caudatus TaxID=37621 RepID=A0ABM1F6Y2_PRICU|nr:PREDICTED: uncharacterized protein LOC106820174 [Priapulus caudatus]